jgi:hypothetical protein
MTLALSVDGLRTVTRLQPRGNTLAMAISTRAMEAAMNWSMYTADRTAHLRIAVAGLAAVLLIAVVGIFL